MSESQEIQPRPLKEVLCSRGGAAALIVLSWVITYYGGLLFGLDEKSASETALLVAGWITLIPFALIPLSLILAILVG